MATDDHSQIIKKAIKNNEFKKLLLETENEDEYPKYLSENTFIDVGVILKELYSMYEKGDMSIPQLLTDTIYNLLKGSPIHLWTAYSVIWSQLWFETTEEATFIISNPELLEKIKKKLLEKKTVLSSCKIQNRNFNENIWEHIINSNQIIHNCFGIKIL